MNNSQGMGLFGWLFIVFLVLKLTGYIDWSWWWVTCPIWGAFALGLVIFIVAFVFFCIKDCFKK